MEQKVRLSLLFTRAAIFLVMLMWTLDKFFNPGHTAAVFEKFYALPGLGTTIVFVMAVAELILLLLFLIGYKKFITYGIVMALHAVSTFASFKLYLSPFDNLLFFAAWPMLAACVYLFVMRQEDQLLSVS